MKTCRVCNKAKGLEDFYKDQNSPDSHSHRCKDCKNAQVAQWRSKNKDQWNAYMRVHRAEHPASAETRKKNAARARKSRYGMTQEQYDKMLSDQKNSCAICHKHENGFKKRLFVDHCHSTKKIRGLLCSKCNYYLGYIGESQTIVSGISSYLK